MKKKINKGKLSEDRLERIEDAILTIAFYTLPPKSKIDLYQRIAMTLYPLLKSNKK